MWFKSPEDRLHEWREFRLALNKTDLPNALFKTVHLWSYAPFVRYYLSPQNDPKWPDPWTLLHENYYCDIAKALGMLYTIYLTAHSMEIESVEIWICKDRNNNDYNLVNINNGKYILNYEYDSVVNIEQLDNELEVLHVYTAQDLQLEKY